MWEREEVVGIDWKDWREGNLQLGALKDVYFKIGCAKASLSSTKSSNNNYPHTKILL